MGRITKTLTGPAVGLLFCFLAACENPLLAIIEDKVARARGEPDISVSFKGSGVPAGAEVNIGSAAFGGVPRQATFTISNTGKVPLTLTGDPLVSISGADSSSFSPATLPYTTIAAGANSSFTLEFAPTSVAPKEAAITIASDDPDTPAYAFTVTGSGVASNGPAIQVERGATILDAMLPSPAYDFGAIKTGHTADAVFTIRNVGTPGETLSLASTPITFVGSGFGIVSPPVQDIDDGETTTFTVRFSASATPGTYSAAMTIASNAVDEPAFPVDLSGSGVAPDLEVRHEATVIDPEDTYGSMGTVWTDGPGQVRGADVTFTIHNTGAIPLSITGVTLSGANPADFVLNDNTVSELAAGGQTGFLVIFDPSQTGTRTATLTIATDASAPKDAYRFYISGEGIFTPKVYWAGTGNREIYRADLDGSNSEVLYSGLSQEPQGLAIDPTQNKMYIAYGPYIMEALLDGSYMYELLAPGGNLYGISIDSDFVYWANLTTNRIGQAYRDSGSIVATISQGQAWGIVADPASPFVYWSSNSSGNVYRCPKGSLSYILPAISTIPAPARGMAWDDSGSRFFWGYQTGQIFVYPPGVTFLTAPSDVQHIAIDSGNRYIFWTSQTGNVYRDSLDSPGSYSIIATTSGGASGIALDLVP